MNAAAELQRMLAERLLEGARGVEDAAWRLASPEGLELAIVASQARRQAETVLSTARQQCEEATA